jgi:hypothetical protein
MTSSISSSSPFSSAAQQSSAASSSTMTNASQSSNFPSHRVTGALFQSLPSSLEHLDLSFSTRSQLTIEALRRLSLPPLIELHMPPVNELPHSFGTLHYISDLIPDEEMKSPGKHDEIKVPLLKKKADVTNKRNKNT